MSGEQPAPSEQAIERDGPRIYVASLTDYNAGILHGHWYDATLDLDVLGEAISEMLAESPTAQRYGETAEEWAIHDYEGFNPVYLGEYENLTAVHQLATGIEAHGPAFGAWWSLDERSHQDHGDLTSQFEQAYAGHHESLEAYGEELLSEMGFTLDELAIPDAMRPYVHLDVAGLARDLELGGDINHLIDLLADPERLYRRAPDSGRRLLNGAIFERIYVDSEEVVDDLVREPFARFVTVGRQATRPGQDARSEGVPESEVSPPQGRDLGPPLASLVEPSSVGSSKALMVRERGFEPPRLAALAPQTSVSTVPPLAPMQ